MAVKAFAVLVVLSIAVVLLYSPQRTAGCSYSRAAAFTFAREFSLQDAAKGQWEVFEPNFTRTSLILAYRYMSGLGLNEAERNVVSQEALGSGWRAWPDPNVWLNARRTVPSASPIGYIETYRREGGNYSYYVNCLDDAFVTAGVTLGSRVAQFGAGSPAVADWLRAQDMVFQNCSGKAEIIPPAASQDLPPLIRADRAYQIAAAHFYAAHFEQAEGMFRAIASDSSSPWHVIAPYVAARCAVRRATLGMGPPDAVLLARAEADIRGILEKGELRAIHEPSRKLLAFILNRLHPQERLLGTSRALMNPNRVGDAAQTLVDYRYLLCRVENAGEDAIGGVAAKDDLTDWVLTFPARRASSREHAYAKWKATASAPWLTAAIASAAPNDATREELLAAAGNVKPDSPAYPTVAFHTVRLLADSGREAKARDRLDILLSKERARLTVSTRNLFLAQRMKLARNLDELLRYAPRVSAGGEYYGAPERGSFALPPESLFDADAALVLTEKLPLSMLVEAVASPRLPLRLQREVALATWTRAILLEDAQTATALAPTVVNLEPLLKSDFGSYLAASNPEDRRFAAAFAMLRNPGLNPSVRPNLLREVSVNLRGNFATDNWWCKMGQRPEGLMDYNPPLMLVYPRRRIESVAFLDDASRQQAAREWDRLSSLPPAANYLGGIASEYARAHPDDPRVPEALYRVVRATYYGCTDESTGKFSKEAFDLLHGRYPKSPWTEKTPYWFR